MYFAQINDDRRFVRKSDGAVLAFYDRWEGISLYAEVGSRDGGKTVEFVSEPRHYWADEIESAR